MNCDACGKTFVHSKRAGPNCFLCDKREEISVGNHLSEEAKAAELRDVEVSADLETLLFTIQ